MKNKTHDSPLLPSHHMIFWLSSFFSILTLAQATGFVVSSVSFIYFFIAIILRANNIVLNISKRLISFAVLVILTLIVGGGLTADVGTSFLACLIVTKLPEMKYKKDSQALVFFNILSPFIAFLQYQTPIIFMLGLLSLILAIASSRSLHEISHQKTNLRTTAKIIRTTIIQSLLLLPFVATLYIITPRLDNPFWSSYATARTGVGDEMNISRWTRLLNDTSTAFRVSFSSPPPPNNEMYFRGLVLWSFDGDTWRQTPSSHEIRDNVDSFYTTNSSIPISYNISYESIRANRLFSLDYPISHPEHVSVKNDGSSNLTSPPQSLDIFSWQSSDVTFKELTEGEMESALQLPENSNPRMVQWAIEKREEFESDKDFADYVMNHFSSEFEYSMSPPRLSSTNSMDDFFFSKKIGFCPHYSSAFAILMRAANIPTRVVNGYIGHEAVVVGGYYRIRQADAHAWNEVWIDGEWVRYDPTHEVTISRTRNDFAWNILSITHDLTDWLSTSWSDLFLNYNYQTQQKMIENIKQWFFNLKSLFTLKIILLSSISIFGFFAIIIIFARLKRFKRKESFAYHINEILNTWGSLDFDVGDSWQVKIDYIVKTMEKNEKELFLNYINQAREYIYSPNPSTEINPRKIIYELKKMQSDKNNVKLKQ